MHSNKINPRVSKRLVWNIAIAYASVIYNNDIYLFNDSDRRTESEIEHIVRVW